MKTAWISGAFEICALVACLVVFREQAVVAATLAEALDAPDLTWTSAIDPWLPQTAVTHDGEDAAKSGSPARGPFGSRLETSVNGPGTLTFWWKISPESTQHSLQFQVDGTPEAQATGQDDWEFVMLPIPPGMQTLRWVYVNRVTVGVPLPGWAAWLDEVHFFPAIPSAPVILRQPERATVAEGGAVTFSVTAVASPAPAYQWQFNGNEILGATGSVLTLTGVTLDQSGDYSVVVSNSEGSVNSEPVALAVRPLVPVSLVGSWQNDVGGEAVRVFVAGRFAYVAAKSAGLIILNAADPSRPERVGRYRPTFNWVNGVFVAGQYAYVAADFASLEVVDVSDPANPRRVGQSSVIGPQAGDVWIFDEHAYVASTDFDGSYDVFSVRDPGQPVLVKSYFLRADVGGIAFSGSTAYIAATGKFLVSDVSDPRKPQSRGSYDTGGAGAGVDVAGSYAYIADGPAGLHVVEVSYSAGPKLVGGYDTSGSALGVAVSGSYAWIADGSAGVQLIDVTDPLQPVRVGGNDTLGFAGDVVLSGEHAFVASGSAGLHVLRISEKELPPTIKVQPQTRTASSGSLIVFDVNVAGTSPMTFQWFKNGEAIADETDQSLAITEASAADSGVYHVTVSNAHGSATSINALLRVISPVRLVALGVEPFRLSFSDPHGVPLRPADLPYFDVQSTIDLITWTPLTASQVLTDSRVTVTDPGSVNSPTRFYRVIER